MAAHATAPACQMIETPDAVEALRHAAEARAGADRPGARGWLRRLLRVAPHDVAALRRLAELHLADGHLREARPLLAAHARLLPHDPAAHRLMERGFGPSDRPAARRALRRALALRPDLPETLSRLAFHEICDAEAEAAARLDRRVLRFQPGNASVHLRLGQALRQLGRRDQATIHLRRACALDAGLIDARRRLVARCLARGDVSTARDLADELTIMAADDAEARDLVSGLDRIVAGLDRPGADGIAAPTPLRGGRRVSVTIPSLNPVLLGDTLRTLALGSTELDVEAVVVSTFEVRGAGVTWVPERERRGSVAAHAQAMERASGDLLINLADDRAPMPGAIDVAVAQLDARAREGVPISIGFNWIIHNEMSAAGTSYGYYYPYFHLMTRSSMKRIGGWMDPAYRKYFCDADMAMRVWAAGGRCELAPAAMLVQHPLSLALRSNFVRSSLLEIDMRTYQERWRPRFGAGWGDAFDDFHIDYPIDRLVAGTMQGRHPPRRS